MPRRKGKPKAKGPAKVKGTPTQHIRERFDSPNRRGNSPFTRPHGHTLADEARNTASNRRGFRGRDARLRYQPVTFVSTGFMDPLKDFELPEQTNPSAQAKAAVPGLDADSNPVTTTLNAAELRTRSPGVNSTAQDEPALAQNKDLDARPEVASDSSEEVILFKGRNHSRRQQKSPSPTLVGDGNDSRKAVVSREINLELRLAEDSTNIATNFDTTSRGEELDFISLSTNSGKHQLSRKPLPNRDLDEDDEEAAIIADYIANVRAGFDDNDEGEEQEEEDIGHPGLGSHPFNILRDLGGTDSDAIPSQPSSGDESGDELDDEEDEEEQHRLELEDEDLALFIAKQEELGLGDDDVILFDGPDPDDGWIAATSMPRRKKGGASKKSRMFQGGSQFPSATRMAEAFDEMDLMDISNSRLRKSKKGIISFDLSDSELEDALNIAIKKDRLKKADKKKAREELRSQGLLGRNVDPNDLRVKYQGGMSLDDLADELEAFMLSTREQLVLPPFDKGARKIVHNIANVFNIKSKSAGAGTGRYPVLYRTKATLPYNEPLFEQAFSRIRRTWFPRVDVDEKVAQQTRILKRAEVRTGKSRTGKSSIVLREGDVVGQHASEIGVENKGRAMLEKMGWSKGMSLGTVETQGIIVPLTHVIKKTKAGLGDI
ncbi:hypothetical protein NUW58_g8870 [Xylaria curta]|uniref:Uncharacterized protein n=1 Tax=Xylaria curta TaxID=42375 RepID=A0ACC1N5F9_9PEZI|nr:hypothetical protein NUW58_g8870 [Xylaria curta]